MDDLHARISSAAHDGALGLNNLKAPTLAQQKAGNYRVGRLMLNGLAISIEQPRNSFREGTDPNGVEWRCRMAADYGYIRGYRGADGDNVDIFIGLVPESDKVFVINQVSPDTGEFDEHKVMMGFMSEAAARQTYLESYSRGWKGLGSIVPCTLSQLKWWLKNGDLTRPISAKSLPYDGHAEMNQWDTNANPVGTDMTGLMYKLRQEDEAGLLLDAVTVGDVLEDADAVLEMDALVTPYSQVARKMGVLQTVMSGAGDTVKPVAMQVTDPFKQAGTTNVAAVFELSDGQTVSIFFHNPDTTPTKIKPQDDLISWKWMLNKKDITLLVAPENGADLNVREVARRIMKVAEKNSPRFAQANKNRAERLAAIASLKTDVESKEAELASLTEREAELQAQLAARMPAATDSDESSVVLRGGNGISITVAKTKYREDEWGVSYASTDIATAHSKEEAVAIAQRVIDSGADNIAAMRAAANPDTPESQASVGLDKIKAVFTDTQPIDGVPADWIIMNAPRPLVGDKLTEGGEFLDGRFYAAIDPNASTFALYVNQNVKSAAAIVMVIPKDKQAAMAISGTKYEAQYKALPAEQRARAVQPLINKLQGKTYGELKALLASAQDIQFSAVDQADSQFVADAADGKVDFMDAANIDRLEAIEQKYHGGELGDQLGYAKTAAMDAIVDAFEKAAA